MKEKIGKVIVNIIIFGMIACSIYLILVKMMPVSTQNVWHNSKTVDEELNTDVINEEPEVEDENKLYEIGDEIKFGSFTYVVNSAVTTKERGKFPTPTDWKERYTFDENGNLIDDNIYVVINVNIVNNEKELMEMYLNSMSFGAFISLEGSDCDFSECLAFNKIDGYEDKSYFRTALEPNKVYNYDLVYIVSEKSISTNDGRFIIGMQGNIGINDSYNKTLTVKINY